MTKERIHKVEELPEEITQNTEERNEQLGIRKEDGELRKQFYSQFSSVQ